MTVYRIDRASITLAETANVVRVLANAADHHAPQDRTYGAASDTVVMALACGIMQHSMCHFTDARAVARRILDECVDNGENLIYQFTEVFRPGSPHLDPDRGVVPVTIIEVEKLVDRVTGRPATAYTPPEDVVTLPRFRDRFTDEEWAARMAASEAAVEDEHSHGGSGSLNDGCAS